MADAEALRLSFVTTTFEERARRRAFELAEEAPQEARDDSKQTTVRFLVDSAQNVLDKVAAVFSEEFGELRTDIAEELPSRRLLSECGGEARSAHRRTRGSC